MRATEPCQVCKGRCCRDIDWGYRVFHMGVLVFEHTCEACIDGTKYIPKPTYEDGIAEGERRATSNLVAYLRKRHAATQEWDGSESAVSLTYARAADAIERGEHCHKEEK